MNAAEIWKNSLLIIANNVEEKDYEIWFSPIEPVGFQENDLVVSVPSLYFYEHLENNFLDILKTAITTAGGKKMGLQYNVSRPDVSETSPVQKEIYINPKEKNPYLESPHPKKQTNQKAYDPFQEDVFDLSMFDNGGSNLQKGFTFDSFVQGDCNQFAYRASLSMSDDLDRPSAFNPLLFYGGVGIGKTHLAHAIGNEILAQDTTKKVLYTTTHQFVNQFVNSLQSKNTNKFASYYMQIDVLIIDDVQFMINKKETQKIFFNIFNELILKNKKIILTSDRPPSELNNLEDRLVSRFSAGIVCDMYPPEYETRLAIVKQEVETIGAKQLPDDVLDYIALRIDTNVRDLKGVVGTITAKSEYDPNGATLDLAKKVIEIYVKKTKKEVGIDYITRLVSNKFKIDIDNICGKKRTKEIASARQVAMYLCKEKTNHTYKTIGHHFGGRDHSTVISAVKAVEDRIDTSDDFKTDVDQLRKEIVTKIEAHG